MRGFGVAEDDFGEDGHAAAEAGHARVVGEVGVLAWSAFERVGFLLGWSDGW